MPSAPSGEPLYLRVERMLRRRIRDRHKPGEVLPTQQAIAAQTGASLITVKRALAELARQGLVEGIRGRGTVVRRTRIADNHANVSSWTDSIAGAGAEPRTAWTKIATRVPPPKRARLLGLKARQRTVLLTRLRLVDGQPLCLMSNELALALAPDLPQRGLDRESFYACLGERYGLRPATADEEVQARLATAKERRLLGASVKIVLVVRRLSFLADGGPLELSRLVAPADRYQYQVRLSAPGTGSK